MISPYIPFFAWFCIVNRLEKYYLGGFPFLMNLGAPFPKLLMSTIRHGSLN